MLVAAHPFHLRSDGLVASRHCPSCFGAVARRAFGQLLAQALDVCAELAACTFHCIQAGGLHTWQASTNVR